MKNPDLSAYILKGIPKPLWAACQAKAKAHEPPASMRWVLLRLLTRWAEEP